MREKMRVERKETYYLDRLQNIENSQGLSKSDVDKTMVFMGGRMV